MASVDEAFIRRAVELADLNAVRVALYQNTRDPEIAALPMAANFSPAQRELLITKATAWLAVNASTEMPPEPPEAELRELIDLATKEAVGELEYQARRELPGFTAYPWAASWAGAKADIPEGFRVAIIGSGFSGIALGVQFELLGIPYVVLDRQPEPGGTWSVNTYPDIRVDTPSITYEYSFEKRHPWSEYFARGGEVREYLEHISKKYGVFANTRFEHDLQRASWDDARHVWNLEASTPQGTVTIEANILINALGTFNNPLHPDIEGLDSFTGRVMHTARWPKDVDFAGKRVAVIGNGSTGVQLVWTIAQELGAEHVSVFQRTPQWISPRPGYGKPMDPEVRWLVEHFPGFWNWWRYMATAALFNTHGHLRPDPEWQAKGGRWNQMNDQLRADLTAYIVEQTGGRQDLVDRLVPEYAPFSRRPVVDNNWYKALTLDHVDLVTDAIARVTPNGIETADGVHRDVDIIITATGYDVAKYLYPQTYLGKGGLDVHDFWSTDGARAYLSMMVPNFPNMFIMYGPNSQALSGGTGLPMWYVVWSAYIANCVMRMLETGSSEVEVKLEAYERYNKALDAEAASLLLMQPEGAPDKNYYINSSHGRMQVNAPWYGPEYQRLCSYVEWDDIDLR